MRWHGKEPGGKNAHDRTQQKQTGETEVNSEKIKVKKKARNEGRPGYKKTKVGWIPEEWECVRLRNLGDGVRPAIKAGPFGSSLKKEYYVKNGYKIYGQEQVISGDPFCGDYFIDEKRFESLRSCEVLPGDILLSLVGTIGKAMLIPPDYQKGIINPRLLRISLSKNRISSLYVKYYLEAEHTLSLLSNWSQGGTMGVLNAQIVGALPIPLPPLPEQKKIAEILSAWDRAIEQVGKLIDAKERLKKGLTQQLLTGRMRFPEFGKPVEKKDQLPEGWEKIRAKKMFVRRSIKNCGKETVLSVTQDIGVIPRDVLDRKINMTDSNTDTYKLVEPGDFVISLRSFQGGIEYSNHRGIVSPAYHVIRPIVKVDNDFYRHYFKSSEFVGHIAIAVIGIRDGKQINYDDFAFLKFPYPPVAEQTRIAAVLSTCDREIELLKKKLEKLKEQKKGLMQKLLTGEIRVKAKERDS